MDSSSKMPDEYEIQIDEHGTTGTTRYYKNKKYHRLDGPAIKNTAGSGMWYCEGNLHRLDGPAIVWSNGKGISWYINGWEVTTEIREWANELGIDLENLSEDEKLLIVIKWSDYDR